MPCVDSIDIDMIKIKSFPIRLLVLAELFLDELETLWDEENLYGTMQKMFEAVSPAFPM